MPMERLLSLVRGESAESPREITPPCSLIGESGSNGWLIRFFDSPFFCEWIAVSYLYKHQHSGVRDYLCNRMYTLPLSGIESYLFQICYLMVHKPSPSLDKFVIDICAKSLKIALKVQWFLLAELEDSDDNEGISRIQEKCQIAATLVGGWSPLIRPQNDPSTPGSKNQVLSKFLSSKQKFFSLTLSPPTQKSLLHSPSSRSNLQDDGSQLSADDNKIFKRLIPSPKVRDALLFRKSADKDDEENEKEGFFKRLLRDSRGEDDEQESNSEGFLKRLLKDNNKSEDEEITNSSEGFFKRLLSSKGDDEELTSSSVGFFKRLLRDNKGDEEELGANSESFFKKLLRENKNEDEDPNANSEGFFKKLFRDSKTDDEKVSKAVDDEETDGFVKKLFKEDIDGKRHRNESNETDENVYTDENPGEDNEKEGFFKKKLMEKFEDKQDTGITDKGNESEDDESSEFSLFKRFFRRHREGAKPTPVNELNNSNDSLTESSPETENFFLKLFRDRDRSVEDSELVGSKKFKEKCPGSPKQRNDTSSTKPPLPSKTTAQFRKGAYHESLEFVHSLCETSYDLVDTFPTDDRKTALRESLAEINSHLTEAENTGGICFPMGRGVYRVVNIPEDESVLLNSREKVPYMICVEVLKAEIPSGANDTSNSHKLSKGGIPLANGNAFSQKPPPWAYPLSTAQEVYRNSTDRMSLSTVQAIDQAMTHKSEVKLVNASLSVDKRSGVAGVPRNGLDNDLEWVRVVLTADPGLRMESIADPGVPRRKEHRRVPSIVAYEEVRVSAS